MEAVLFLHLDHNIAESFRLVAETLHDMKTELIKRGYSDIRFNIECGHCYFNRNLQERTAKCFYINMVPSTTPSEAELDYIKEKVVKGIQIQSVLGMHSFNKK